MLWMIDVADIALNWFNAGKDKKRNEDLKKLVEKNITKDRKRNNDIKRLIEPLKREKKKTDVWIKGNTVLLFIVLAFHVPFMFFLLSNR